MVAFQPFRCRPQAYESFSAALPKLRSARGLMQAAAAIQMHADPQLCLEEIEAEIDRLAGRVRCRLKSLRTKAAVVQLHQVLFEDEGFDGNREDYYNADNCYLANVLRTKRGIPIALALVYKLVAARLSIHVDGIGAPGHFLARVEMDERPTLVDPFERGRVLTRAEAIRVVEQTTGCRVPQCVDVLQPVTHQQWIARMLNNLQVVYARSNRCHDLAAMRELAALL